MSTDFNKIVNKLWRKWWKIISREDIFEYIDPELKSENMGAVNKIVYRLKASGVIISLKAGLYVIPKKEDMALHEVDLLEKYYTPLLKKIITSQVGSHYYISWEKSLQVHMRNFSIPEKIFIVNRSVNKKIVLWEKEIIFKTLSGNDQGKKINLYSRFSRFVETKDFDGIALKFSSLELALFESALVSDSQQGCDVGLLVQAIKKYKQVLDVSVFEEIGKYKYIMACNRLKEISKPLDIRLYECFLRIIKQNGGCFVGEGMRGI
jgi:hypothetical protein